MGADTFHEDQVGLDHISFAVKVRAELVTAVHTLERQGVGHGHIKDNGEAWILDLRDHDNIALELFARKRSSDDA